VTIFSDDAFRLRKASALLGLCLGTLRTQNDGHLTKSERVRRAEVTRGSMDGTSSRLRLARWCEPKRFLAKRRARLSSSVRKSSMTRFSYGAKPHTSRTICFTFECAFVLAPLRLFARTGSLRCVLCSARVSKGKKKTFFFIIIKKKKKEVFLPPHLGDDVASLVAHSDAASDACELVELGHSEKNCASST
jgi:hypothetical protein